MLCKITHDFCILVLLKNTDKEMTTRQFTRSYVLPSVTSRRSFQINELLLFIWITMKSKDVVFPNIRCLGE